MNKETIKQISNIVDSSLTDTYDPDMTDFCEVIGVDSEGYGKVSKCLMLDTHVEPSAKGLFAYYATYTGGGRNFAFPSRAKILRDLRIGSNTMYKFRKQLEDRGYVRVHEVFDKKHQQMNNHYVIDMCPENVLSELGKDKYHSAIMRLKGWGNMPRMVALDDRLDLKSIGLYGYISSLSGSDGYCTFKYEYQKLTFGLKKEPFQKHLRKLVDCGYLTKYQLHVNGAIRGTVYELTDHRLSCKEIEDAKKQKVRSISEEEYYEMFGVHSDGGPYRISGVDKHEVTGSETTDRAAENRGLYEVTGFSTTEKSDTLGYEVTDSESAAFEISVNEPSENRATNINNKNNNKNNKNNIKQKTESEFPINDNLKYTVSPSLVKTPEEKKERDALIASENHSASLLSGITLKNYKDAIYMIKSMTHFDEWSDNDSYLDLSIETLSRMMTDKRLFRVKGFDISSMDVTKKLEARINEYGSKSCVVIGELLCTCAGKMEEADTFDDIHIGNKQAYMRSIIYDSLLSGSITVEDINDLNIQKLYINKRKELTLSLSNTLKRA